MAALTFKCPRTGKEVDPGIEADATTRHRLQILFCRVRCPHCGFEHFPPVKRGAFAEPEHGPLPSNLTRLLDQLECVSVNSDQR
jgi:hypothetical protein